MPDRNVPRAATGGLTPSIHTRRLEKARPQPLPTVSGNTAASYRAIDTCDPDAVIAKPLGGLSKDSGVDPFTP